MSIVYGMSDEEYHSRPELSSTGARLLLDAPAKFRYAMDHPKVGKRAFDVGHAAHTKILGVGSGLVEYPPEHLTPSGAVSTKAATVLWAEEMRAEGLTPVSPADVAAVDAMAESVLAHPEARRMLELSGEREVSVFAEIEGVPVRARFDGLTGEGAFDLKTSRKPAHAEGFARAASDLGYHVQEGWYRDAADAVGLSIDWFRFIVVEITPPYLVGVNELDFIFREMGRTASREARKRFRHGRDTGEWPGYSPKVEFSSVPPWVAMMHEQSYGEIQI